MVVGVRHNPTVQDHCPDRAELLERLGTGGLAPFVVVPAISCLGKVRSGLSVLAHDMPPVVPCHGLLGLDYFRGYVPNLDFIRGHIALRVGRWRQFWR